MLLGSNLFEGKNFITRGYFIGQIIDELTAVSQQVKSRAKLQLMDLNRYLEDFFKEILNTTLDYKLINLNEDRSNNPGLDLGDEAAEVAFQITSTKSSEKINETLKKAKAQKNKFPTVYVLILQGKQSSYTLKEEHTKHFGFEAEEHIWDIDDLLKKILGLPLDKLQNLHTYITREVARVKIELEVPDQNGQYQTNIDKYIEAIPKESLEGVAAYHKFHTNKSEPYGQTEVETEGDFKKFIRTLKKLPRITRQFYAFLLERGEWDDRGRGTNRYVNEDHLKRICKLPDMDGELRLLGEQGLCWWCEPDDHGESATWRINAHKGAESEYFIYEFLEYVSKKDLNLAKAIVSLDFSDFK
ncbi:SMEK domain-containing protein [Burkholderia ambifaria]|uniref:SMEK domain-containing protein n=1 Tax=Burkholderia ambifaria TaxID=152480 RepID=UPI00158FAB20|nr:SMEK domain-containing protein [Burkholderia ambifaria]